MDTYMYHVHTDLRKLQKMPQIQKVRAEGAGGTCGQSHSWEDVQTQSKIQDPFGEKEGAWLIEMKRGRERMEGRILGEAKRKEEAWR